MKLQNFVICLVCKIIIKIIILPERKRLSHTVSALKEMSQEKIISVLITYILTTRRHAAIIYLDYFTLILTA